MGGGGGVRRVATAYLVLGVGAACLALYAISLDPAAYRQLQVQLIKESGPHPPEPGQTATDCAATAAEAMATRANAVLLLLLGAAQAMTAVAATSRVFTVLAMCMSPFTALKLLDVLDGLTDLAIGRCHGQGTYHQLLVAGYATASVSFTLLFMLGLVVTLCVQNTAGMVLLNDLRATMQAPVPVATESRATNDSTANTTRQGAVSMVTVEDSGVRTVPNGDGTALAAVTTGKPAPAHSGGATTVSAGCPSHKQGRIKDGAASTSQALPPGNLQSQAQGPGFMFPYQQAPALPQLPSLPQPPALPQLPSLPQLPALPQLLQPQQGVHGHGVHQAGFTMVLQNVSLSLQGSGTVWVAASSATSHPTWERSRMITQGGAAPMQQSLQLHQLPSPAATGSQLRLTDN